MRLAEARRRSGYSARGFAKATKSSTRTIWELERGRRLPKPYTVRKLAEVLAVPAGDVEEFREAIRKEACRNAPPEVLAQVEEMELSEEVDLVNATVVQVAAQRSLQELMEYLVRSGHAEEIDRIYREVFGQAVRRKETSSDRDTGDS
jgi:transcriptional regulator with XRE-family HTH domain